MHLIFGNPAGWWALLGVPALIVIHFLQRKSRRVEISTMFLLEHLEVESRAGRRLERWRNSLLFWLQVLAVILLAWMLSDPRWVESGTVQRIALVLDSTISMQAFRADTERGLAEDTARLARAAARTEWLLTESDLSRPPLYRGDDRGALLAALKKWNPDLGPHSAAPALRAARGAVGNDGLLFFVTDRVPEPEALPVEAHALAYAKPLDNVGIAAVMAEHREGQPLWRALVRNYSPVAQRRQWWFESGGQRSPAQTLDLKPGDAASLQGAFPEGVDHLLLVLEPDAFTLDDRIPLVLPKAKPLTVAVNGPADFLDTMKPALAMLTDATPGAEGGADLTFALGRDVPPSSGVAQVVFAELLDGSAKTVRVRPAPESNSLMDELNWNGLLYQAPAPIPPRPDDTVLLWDGPAPLIFLRSEKNNGQSLVINVDPRHSNLARLPAFALLLDRFVEAARRRKPAPERANFLAGQSLHLVLPDSAKDAQLEVVPVDSQNSSAPSAKDLSALGVLAATAPSPPAFFKVKAGKEDWLDGASQFPDPRESDFHDTAAVALDAQAQTAREEAHSRPDALTPVWLLILLGTLLFSWREAGRR